MTKGCKVPTASQARRPCIDGPKPEPLLHRHSNTFAVVDDTDSEHVAIQPEIHGHRGRLSRGDRIEQGLLNDRVCSASNIRIQASVAEVVKLSDLG